MNLHLIKNVKSSVNKLDAVNKAYADRIKYKTAIGNIPNTVITDHTLFTFPAAQAFAGGKIIYIYIYIYIYISVYIVICMCVYSVVSFHKYSSFFLNIPDTISDNHDGVAIDRRQLVILTVFVRSLFITVFNKHLLMFVISY